MILKIIINEKCSYFWISNLILVIKESLTNLIEEVGEEEAIDYMPVLERVEAFMEDNEIEE